MTIHTRLLYLLILTGVALTGCTPAVSSLPEIVEPEAVLAGHDGYSFGGLGYSGPSPYHGPLGGGLTIQAFAMPYVESHGQGNFVESGAGWGMELGIWGSALTSDVNAFPGNGFISVSRAELDEPLANVETPYWIASAGIRMPLVGNRYFLGTLGGGVSYHRFARPQTADVWGWGGFLSLGAAWTPARNFYLGVDIQGHVWAPDEGNDSGSTINTTIGGMVWF